LLIFLTPHIVQNPTQLASLSARETTKADAMKALSEEELHKFLDTLPTVEPPLTTNAPPGSGWSNKNK
jgi:hypothetical protein